MKKMRKKQPRLEEGISSAVAVVIVIAVVAAGLGSYIILSGEEGEEGAEPIADLGPKTSDVFVEPSISSLETTGATSSSVSGLVQGANKFAFDIYSKLAEENNNTFLSPYSIHTCLSMTYEGAREKTAQEMREALNLPEESSVRRPAFAEFQKQLNTNRTVELKTANALWPQENYPFYEEYLETVKKYYLARIEALDYVHNASGAVERINAWAAEHTENKIKEVLKSLNPLTRLVLTNAIYFKGNWLILFDKSRTENETFHLPDGSSVETPMMQFHENRILENKFYYAETDNIKALKLLYSGENMSMIFLLPKEGSGGISWLQNNITNSKFENIQEKFEKRKMSKIKIPKFEFETEYKNEFMSALQDLGINAAFIPREANFSGMDGTRGLFISKTVHKAYVKVDEEGTEAAAVTAIVMELTSVQPQPPTFIADHPFMFIIKDEKTGAVLFIGSVINPQSS